LSCGAGPIDISLAPDKNSGVDPSQISSKTILGKIIRLPFRFIPSRTVVPILRGPARGKSWISDCSTNGFWLGYWELDNQWQFANSLRPGDVVYDIGAHAGLFTLISSARVGPSGHVYSFEPFPRNLQNLRRHIELNRLENCTVVGVAVAAARETRWFVPTAHDSAGYLSESGEIRVETISLDEFLYGNRGIRPPKAMKVNAEGAELEILTGAERLLSEHSPLIFLSTHSHELNDKCARLLSAAGYQLEQISTDKVWATKGTGFR